MELGSCAGQPVNVRLELESQRRLEEERQRRREIEDEVRNREETIDNHSFKNPILKTHLTTLLTALTRMDIDFIASHPYFQEGERAILGITRLTMEVWKKKLARLASADTSEGEEVRQILVQIFRGRDEPTRHKWSVRETMEVRLANARGKGKDDKNLSNPIWVLIDSIFTSIRSKLMSQGGKEKESLDVADYKECRCHEVGPNYTCFRCKERLCDRCAR